MRPGRCSWPRCRRCRCTCTCPGACASALTATSIRTSAQAASMPEQRYLDALMADLEAALPLVWGRTVHSIFIGGGTPSLFSPAAIDRLIGDIRARLKLDARLRDHAGGQPRHLREGPLPRLPRRRRHAAVGRRAELQRRAPAARWAACTTARQAIAAVEEAALAFDTFNLDLMYALPGQTLAQLERDLDAGAGADAAAPVGLPPDHRAEHLLRQVPAARCPTTTWPTRCWTASPR